MARTLLIHWENRALFQYLTGHLIVKSCKVSKLRDLYLELYDRSKNLTGTSAAVLPMCLSNFKANLWVKIAILLLRDFMRSYDKRFYRILKHGPGPQVKTRTITKVPVLDTHLALGQSIPVVQFSPSILWHQDMVQLLNQVLSQLLLTVFYNRNTRARVNIKKPAFHILVLMGIPITKIRQSWDCLISIMGIPTNIMVRWHLGHVFVLSSKQHDVSLSFLFMEYGLMV